MCYEIFNGKHLNMTFYTCIQICKKINLFSLLSYGRQCDHVTAQFSSQTIQQPKAGEQISL